MPETQNNLALNLLLSEINAFLLDCQARNLSPNTIRIYRNNLKEFSDRYASVINDLDFKRYPTLHPGLFAFPQGCRAKCGGSTPGFSSPQNLFQLAAR